MGRPLNWHHSPGRKDPLMAAEKKAAEKTRIITIGSSSGGLATLKKLCPQLPSDLPAAVFIVQHIAAEASGATMVEILRQTCRLPCSLAVDGRSIRPGHVYIAPPDAHTLVKNGKILLAKGARE